MQPSIDILGIGYCGLDTLCLLPRIPLDDKVQISRTLVQGGGPAATATVAAARMGLDTAFLGVVGDDARGEGGLAKMQRPSSRPHRTQARDLEEGFQSGDVHALVRSCVNDGIDHKRPTIRLDSPLLHIYARSPSMHHLPPRRHR